MVKRGFTVITGFVLILIILVSPEAFGKKVRLSKGLPERGLCAHRGAMETHPENTVPAFRAAVEAGAHMIEFDVWLTKDNQMVVIHDSSVDRTTNGEGKVSELTFEEIRKLDAGRWKAPQFTGVQIPTPEEVLNEMPLNVWLNIHIKGEGELPVMIARLVEKQGRLHQAFLACSAEAARLAKDAVPGIKICNMDRQESAEEYVAATISARTEFIQLLKKSDYTDFAASVSQLKESGIKVNYFGADSPEELKMLFEAGVDFPLVNDIVHTLPAVRDLGIEPHKPLFDSTK
jgi:glycerophosphoryl diester phosphodiesterase